MESLRAECCRHEFQVLQGIPDHRDARPAWVDFTEDLNAAREVATEVPANDVTGSMRWVFARRKGWTAERVARRTSKGLAMPAKMGAEWKGWLPHAAWQPGPLLVLWCATASLLSVAPGDGERVGIDESMEWLVVAQRLCAAAGVHAHLAAAHAEALPLRDGTIGVAAALDVIEHVGDQAAMVREIDRVLRPGGMFVGATPNRYSLSAEPHVGIWGVGWLPRSLQSGYVQWRMGLPYEFTTLLSHQDLKCIFRQNASFVPTIEPAPVPPSDQARFGRRRRVLSLWYNALLTIPPIQPVARRFGSFFHLSGVKPDMTR